MHFPTHLWVDKPMPYTPMNLHNKRNTFCWEGGECHRVTTVSSFCVFFLSSCSSFHSLPMQGWTKFIPCLSNIHWILFMSCFLVKLANENAIKRFMSCPVLIIIEQMQATESQNMITCSFAVMICELAQLQARLQQLRYWLKTKGSNIKIKGSKGIETIQLEQKITDIEETRQWIKAMLYRKHTQTMAQ